MLGPSIRRLLVRQWFLIALAISFAIGFTATDFVSALSEVPLLRDGLVFVVMTLMGFTLRADAIGGAVRRPTAAGLAIAINIVGVPLLTVPWMWVLPESSFAGLWVASLVPCTLASASMWTRRAGGDDSVAMVTTAVTNLACVAVVPVGMAVLLSQTAKISVLEQMIKLAVLIVAPLVIGQSARRMGGAGWADRNRTAISNGCQVGILFMVAFGAAAGARAAHQGGGESWGSTFGIVIAAAVVHSLALVGGVRAARSAGVDSDGQIAVGFSGSQKTLMIGLQVALDCGVSVVPMLIYHVQQLAIDTFLADRWRTRRLPDDTS